LDTGVYPGVAMPVGSRTQFTFLRSTIQCTDDFLSDNCRDDVILFAYCRFRAGRVTPKFTTPNNFSLMPARQMICSINRQASERFPDDSLLPEQCKTFLEVT
jgi:hypothetical protein